MVTVTSDYIIIVTVELVLKNGYRIRHFTSLGYPRLTTGIPVGKPVGMETRGSELLVVTGLHGSGCSFSALRVLATSTREIKVLFIYSTNLIYYITHFDILSSVENFTWGTAVPLVPVISFY